MFEGAASNHHTISKDIPEEKKIVVKNLYVSNNEKFIAMQVDLEIPLVISILKELNVYRGQMDDEKEVTLVNQRA